MRILHASETDSAACSCKHDSPSFKRPDRPLEMNYARARRSRSSHVRKHSTAPTWAAALITVYCCLTAAEGGKVRLIPRPRQAAVGNVAIETGNKMMAVAPIQEPRETLTLEDSAPQQLTDGTASLSVPLQAVLVKNEQGEHVLQLSVETAKVLQTAIEAPSTQATLPGEAPPLAQAAFTSADHSEPRTLDAPPAQASHPQDQLVIFSTVATMALLVGALSARRLRTRQMLNFCIENDSLEDDLAFDAAYTTKSTIGAASSFYGGYDTFSNNGSDFNSRFNSDLRWRGDLEKFDV